MFFDRLRPPNFEIYPNSDANLYDRTALNLLTTGEYQTYTYKFDPSVGKRPLLVLYQAGLHSIAGPEYSNMVLVQVGVFSILPALIYWLGTTLHSRTAGVLAGLLVIFRERNGLVLSNTVTGVHSQLFMSEIPTTIGLVLFLVILIKSIKSDQKQGIFFSGGVLGLTMLIRQEVAVLLPLIGLGMILIDRQNYRLRVGQLVSILAGLVLVISPWIVRNWSKSGQIYFDVPGNRLELIFNTLSIAPDNSGVENPGDRSDKYQPGDLYEIHQSVLNQTGLEGEPGKQGSPVYLPDNQLAAEGISEEIRAVASHFSNQLIQSIVYLPSYPLMIDVDFISKGLIGKLNRYYGGVFFSPEAYVKSLPYWWTDWSGKVEKGSLLLVMGVVFLLSVGIVDSWRVDKNTALIPLLGFLGYISIFSLIRRSGGRFLQEMDWITLLYFCFGLATLLRKMIKQTPNGEKISSQISPDVDLKSKAWIRPIHFRWLSVGMI